MNNYILENAANINRQLGCLLRDRRIKAGLSQEAAAAKGGVDLRTWRRYENGNSTVPAAALLPYFPELQEHLETHITEHSCSGNCEKCQKAQARIKRSRNVIPAPNFGPKNIR